MYSLEQNDNFQKQNLFYIPLNTNYYLIKYCNETIIKLLYVILIIINS